MMLRKITAGLMITLLIFAQLGLTVLADEEEKTPEQIAEEELEAAVCAMPVESNNLDGWPQGPGVYAESQIVMDINTGSVLYAKNIDEKQFPASITKIMTALVALENSQLTDRVKFTEDSISFLEYGDAHIGMKAGEEISMEDALYGMMLASANEVSHAIAECAGGFGYEGFIAKMNEKAEELGCTNTHFVNANGLHDDDHYVSARDMALISAAAYQHEEFRKIIQTLQYTIPVTNITNEERIFQQNHKMLFPENPNYYENCTGGKTGYTDQALSTLVTYADDGNVQLVAVNLRSHGANVYTDARALFDYTYSNFNKIKLAGTEDTDKIESFADAGAYLLLPNNFSVSDLEISYALDEEGRDSDGIVTYSYEGQPMGSQQINFTDAYYKELKKANDIQIDKMANNDTPEDTNKGLPFIVKLLIGVVLVIIVLFMILLCIANHRQKVRAARRRRRRRRR